MKSKVLTVALMLILPISAMADRHGHYGRYGGYGGYGGHHHQNRGGGNRWIAPAIIGGVIAGSALYGVTRDREVVIERDPNEDYYRRELVRQELLEEQLRQRERELERRERQLYGNYYQQQPAMSSDERCNEYYRNNGDSNYYSRNCW
jgi:hypothetical protein